MGFTLEIEKKFLCDGSKVPLHKANKFNEVKQFYLTVNDNLEIRVVVKNSKKAELTVKTVSDYVREEYNYPIPVEEALALEALKVGNTILKKRYFVPLQGEVLQLPSGFWEIDVYDGVLKGLVVAEIEFPESFISKVVAIKHPGWIKKEITQDSRYKNSQLALFSHLFDD